MSTLIKKGTIVTSSKTYIADIRVKGEHIIEIGSLTPDMNETVIDATGKLVFPGIIDPHVHFHMNVGNIFTADDFENGSKLALANGITTVIDFAAYQSTLGVIKSIDKRIQDAKSSYIDYKFHLEVTSINQVKQIDMDEVRRLGIKSFKIYTTYGSDMIPMEDIEPLFILAKDNDITVMVHAEKDQILKEAKEKLIKEGMISTSFHPHSRPRDAEISMITYVIKLAEKIGTKIYIAHISTSEGVALLKGTNDNIMGETCPHYLLLDDSSYHNSDAAKYIMSPPLRKKEDNIALFKGVLDSTIACLSTDHCAFTEETKLNSNTFYETYSGVAGCETLLPLMYTLFIKEDKSLNKLVEVMSTNAAKIFGMYPKKGTIETGSLADIVIYDPNFVSTINRNNLQTNANYTVFEGFPIKGKVETTISKGNVLYQFGRYSLNQRGKYIK